MTETYMCHFGIKNQKHGVRRYQYENGTYTKAGNERYRPSKGKRKTVEKTFAAVSIAEIAYTTMATYGKKHTGTALSSVASKLVPAVSTTASNIVDVGKAAAQVAMNMPAPIAALALPVATIGSLAAVANVKYSYKNTDGNKKQKLSAAINSTGGRTILASGALASGIALTAISGNPMPAVGGVAKAAGVIAAPAIKELTDKAIAQLEAQLDYYRRMF